MEHQVPGVPRHACGASASFEKAERGGRTKRNERRDGAVFLWRQEPETLAIDSEAHCSKDFSTTQCEHHVMSNWQFVAKGDAHEDGSIEVLRDTKRRCSAAPSDLPREGVLPAETSSNLHNIKIHPNCGKSAGRRER